MNMKNSESKRTFIPKKIGETLKKVNKSYSAKFGKIEFLIISKWPQIVGNFFAEYSEPDKISRITNDFNELDEPIYKNFLHVKVSPAAAIEFQHYKDTIIEKINSYFGYKAISDLRLQQNVVPKKNIKLDSLFDDENLQINRLTKALSSNILSFKNERIYLQEFYSSLSLKGRNINPQLEKIVFGEEKRA